MQKRAEHYKYILDNWLLSQRLFIPVRREMVYD